MLGLFSKFISCVQLFNSSKCSYTKKQSEYRLDAGLVISELPVKTDFIKTTGPEEVDLKVELHCIHLHAEISIKLKIETITYPSLPLISRLCFILSTLSLTFSAWRFLLKLSAGL